MDWHVILESFKDDIEALEENERQVLCGMILSWVTSEEAQLEDCKQRFTKKGHFAKQYRIFKRDKDRTLKKMKSMAASHMSPECKRITMEAYEKILNLKLSEMQHHYKATWGEDIENAPTTGCAVLVLLFLAATLIFGL